MIALSFRSFVRFALFGAFGLSAAGCTHAGDGAGVSLEQSVPSKNSGMMALAPEGARLRTARAIVTLPDEAVVSVQDHDYTNGLRQDILLKASVVRGVQNSITVLARTSRIETLDERVPLFKPTEAAIRSEIGGQFPHLTMQVAERESSNAYGPYGLALGRSGDNVRCAYMWQWIDENRLPADAGVTGPVAIRVRLCKTDTTFDAMAAAFDHLTIGGGLSNQVAADGPIQIIEAPGESREPVRVHRKPSRRIATAARHHPKIVQRAAPVAAPMVAADGPRYMSATPVGKATPSASPAVPIAAMQLSGDLPVQAYQGPTATQTVTKTATAKYY